MRSPRIEVSVRRMMVAVAVVALLLCATLLASRVARSLALAKKDRADAAEFARAVGWYRERVRETERRIAEGVREAADAELRVWSPGADIAAYQYAAARLRAIADTDKMMLELDREYASDYSAMWDYSERLEAMHWYAAMHPWLSVPPDPPPP